MVVVHRKDGPSVRHAFQSVTTAAVERKSRPRAGPAIANSDARSLPAASSTASSPSVQVCIAGRSLIATASELPTPSRSGPELLTIWYARLTSSPVSGWQPRKVSRGERWFKER